ncbi:MAG TPA: hypothetical protein PL158_01425 [Bacillota bacterium]|nr:hypothetical protein [Bacillota bacterium]
MIKQENNSLRKELLKIKKLTPSILLLVFLILFSPNLSLADSDLNTPVKVSATESVSQQERNYSFGWQYSKPASGLSVKIPIKTKYYLQPVVAFNLSEAENGTSGRYSLGLRGIYELSLHSELQSYAGIGIGHRQYYGSNQNEVLANNGYEAFFGIEYQKYIIRPALEISMGYYNQSQSVSRAGLSFNFSLLYYF